MSLAKQIAIYNLGRDPKVWSTFCHAPSVNLNFDQTGNATACCYNRQFILGTYPKHTLKEMWAGERARELREYLKNGDLSHGCQLCRHQLEAKNFTGLHAAWYDKSAFHVKTKASQISMPRIMEFETSNVCNLECVMCSGYFSSSIRKNREKLEPMKNMYDDNFVEELRPFLPHLIDMKFLGGEPFLNPLYYKIWDLVIEVNPKINAVITTNASIMNDKVKAMVHKLMPTIVISCDSLDKKTYESIRVNAKFDEFQKNLKVFLKVAEVAKKAMAMSVCPMPNNWKTLPEILHFCNKNMVCLGFNTVVWPPEHSIKNLPKKKIEQIVRALEAECAPELASSLRWWEQKNYHTYQGMLSQIRLWAMEAK